MAGLLKMNQPQDLNGLLNSPQFQGLAQGLLAASGPSAQPIGMGQALGMGLQRGQELEEQQRRRQLEEMMMQQKMAPDFKVVGDQIVKLDPVTGEVQPMYQAPKKAGNDFKSANTLRDEFNNMTKDFRSVQDAYSKISKTTNTGAGDMSMLYQYVKLLDPGSVVRESEFATAAASGSLGERIQGAYKSIKEGGRLPPSLRQEFLNEAKNIYEGQKLGNERVKKTYTDLAGKFDLDPSLVITDYTELNPIPQGAPQPEVGGIPQGWTVRRK